MGVQIQGDTGNVIATKGTYSGDVSIGGTLTYEDVTNIDSVGLITARDGIEVTDKGVQVGTGATVDSASANILTFLTNGSERARIESGGNIGIGTDNPNNLIHSYGGQIKAQSSTDDTSTNVDLIRAQCGSTGNALFSVRAADAADNNSDWDIKTNAGEELSFTIGGAAEKARITSDGKIGIGTTTPSTTVDAIGTVRATSFTATQPEYLRVAHTDASHNQSLSDNVTYTLQFGAEYDDTKDGWTTGSDNYYTIQETGYFLITTQGVLTSSATSSLREWAIGVEKSTDGGSSWSVMMVNGGRGGGNDYTDTDTITPSLTLMEYLAATTRIRVRAWCNAVSYTHLRAHET